jgi:hypothetical protein
VERTFGHRSVAWTTIAVPRQGGRREDVETGYCAESDPVSEQGNGWERRRKRSKRDRKRGRGGRKGMRGEKRGKRILLMLLK